MDYDLDEKLNSIFNNINEWLKFAEQKNATLLVLNGGIIWGVARILPKIEDLLAIVNCLNAIGYTLIMLSALSCITSFFPVLQISWFKTGDKSASDNCLYFAHIAKYSSREYLDLLVKKLNLNENPKITGFHLDLSSQIVTNSEISLGKYKQFKFSSWATVLGFIFFILAFSIYFMGKLF